MSHDAPLDPELLLEHGPFIRALARQLLNDHLRAEDAVQETWLTGLRRPPEDRHALRAWLARVVRNRAIQMRRADRRRDRREASVARSPDVPSPEEILEREALRRRIVEAVMTLEEPYRSTVLLRFFDELPPRLIAKRLSLPVETVKTRLWRATEMLRSRLHDDRPSSHRRAGLAALAGLDRPRDGMLAGWLTSFGTLILGTAMSIKMKLTSAGSLALVIALLIWTPWSGAPATPTEIDRSPVADLEPPSLAVGEESAAPVPTISREGEIVEPASAEPSADELSSEPETRIEGRFVDAMGSPVPGVEVTFRTERSPFDPLESASSDEAGRFSASVQVEEKEAYLPDAAVRARAPGYVSQTLHTRLAAGQTKDLGDIVLESAGFVSGRVLDPVDAGIAGARVFATRPIRSSGPMHVQMARARGPSGDLLSKGVTLGDGSYRLDTAPPGMLMIWAVAEGKLHSFSEPIELTAGEEIPGIDLVLHPVEDTAITGIVLDRSGSPAQRARIRYEGGGSGMMSTDREGRFRIRRDLSLPIDIQAKEKNGDWQSAVLEEVPAGSKDITLVLDQEIPKLRLEVMDTAGNAVEQFLAFARDPSRPRLFRTPVDASDEMAALDIAMLLRSASRVEPANRARVRLGGDEYAVLNVEPGFTELRVPRESFTLEVRADGYAPFERGALDPFDLPSPLRVELVPHPRARGTVTFQNRPVAGARVRLYRATTCPYCSTDPRLGLWTNQESSPLQSVSTDPDGRFEVGISEPGRYVVRAEADGHPPADLGPIELDPSRLPEDLRIRLGIPGSIEGRALLPSHLDHGDLVVSASRGDGFPVTTPIGPDGSYRFDSLTPGPWRVDVLGADQVASEGMSFSILELGDPGHDASAHGPNETKVLEPDWNVHLEEGEAGTFDLDLREAFAILKGRLRYGSGSMAGWTAASMNAIRVSGRSTESHSTELDSEGNFELDVGRVGLEEITFSRAAGELRIRDVMEVLADSPPKSWDIPVGRIEVDGMTSNEESPLILFHWNGRGELTVRGSGTIGPDGTGQLEDVPAGMVRIWQGRSPREDPPDDALRVEVFPEATTRASFQ